MRTDSSPDQLAPAGGPCAWRAADVSPADFNLSLDDDSREEILETASILAANPLDTLALSPRDYPLDACRRVMAAVRERLDGGPGFAVVSGLPVAQLGDAASKQIYWLLASMIERPVAQSHDGRMLYDVRDTGQRIATRVRGDLTRQELSWHTDYGFNHPPPYIGLLVLAVASSGGGSRVASLLSAHDVLRERHPDLLARLYQPFCWNRQGEHPEGDALIHRYPIFERVRGRVRARFIKWLLYRGYELAGERFDELGQRALETLFSLLDEPESHVGFQLEAGQMQFLNNFHLAHCRGEYEDGTGRKRHLVRIFLRNEGRRSYMG